MNRRRWQCWLAACLLLLASIAHGQSCTATTSGINFGNVSPISGAAVPVTGTINVSCTWPAVTLTPSVLVCLNLGATSPRSMSNGSNNLTYDLYQDAAHSLTWGSIYNGTTPISLTLNKPAGTTASQSVPFYGLIAANQPTVPSVGNDNTVYSQNFGGNQTALNYQFYLLLSGGCSTVTTPTTAFPFTNSATVINDCTIVASNVNFGNAGLLTSVLSATGSVSTTCTNGDAYRISFNGGGTGNVAARAMARQGGGGSASYQLYLDAVHATPWGDGTAGTSMYSATGTGTSQVTTIYGLVPIQTTPAPGSYSDTITATIMF
jgi:spore coat protein U-like protein